MTSPAVSSNKKLSAADGGEFFNANAEAGIDSSEDHYIDRETGFIVFTARYHMKRGYCCGSGCRHCPFPKSVE